MLWKDFLIGDIAVIVIAIMIGVIFGLIVILWANRNID